MMCFYMNTCKLERWLYRESCYVLHGAQQHNTTKSQNITKCTSSLSVLKHDPRCMHYPAYVRVPVPPLVRTTLSKLTLWCSMLIGSQVHCWGTSAMNPQTQVNQFTSPMSQWTNVSMEKGQQMAF